MLLTDIMEEYARYMGVTEGINASQVGNLLSVVYGQAVSPTGHGHVASDGLILLVE